MLDTLSLAGVEVGASSRIVESRSLIRTLELLIFHLHTYQLCIYQPVLINSSLSAP